MRRVDFAFPVTRVEDLVFATKRGHKDWLNSATATLRVFTLVMFACLAVSWLALHILWRCSAFTTARTGSPWSRDVGKTTRVASGLMVVIFVGLFRCGLVARLLTMPKGELS